MFLSTTKSYMHIDWDQNSTFLEKGREKGGESEMLLKLNTETFPRNVEEWVVKKWFLGANRLERWKN